MLKITLNALLVVGIALALVPGSAAAQSAACGVYCEEVPDGGGDGPGGQDGGGDSGSGGDSSSGDDSGSGGDSGSGSDTGSGGDATGGDSSALGASGLLGSETLDRFDRLGTDGRAAAVLAGRDAPDSAALRDAAADAQGFTSDVSTAQSAGAGVPVDTLSESSEDEDGIGFGLPILIIGSLLAAVAYALIARRRKV